MRASFRHMYINTMHLQNLPGCTIVQQNKNGFSAELLIRDGKYKLRLDYREKDTPKVYLVYPDICSLRHHEIHLFGMRYHPAYNKELPLLCLTYYDNDKWDSSIPLTRSYIPWAIEWTEFYELWLLTGKWYGRGTHPGGKKTDDK